MNCQLMDTVVDREVFLDLCNLPPHFEWKLLGKRLMVNDKTLEKIQLDDIQHSTLTDKFLEVLEQWKKENGDGATYRKLTKALEKTKLVDDIQVVVNYLQEEHD